MDELRKLGLNKYETAAYEILLKYGKLQAKDIASYSEVPLTAVYPNLKSLFQKGLIQEIKGKVRYFAAIKPVVGLKAFSNRKIVEINSATKVAITSLNSLTHEPKKPEKREIIAISQGLLASHETVKEFMRECKKSLYILGWRFTTSRNMYENLKHLKNLIDKGTDVKIIIISKSSKQKKLIRHYAKAGVKMKYAPFENFSIIIKDSNECKITLKNEEIGERYNLHIQSQDLAKFLNDYFLDVWKKAEGLREQQLLD